MYAHYGLIHAGNMPGAEVPLARWFSALDDLGIDTVFCLATDEELEQESPDYAAWLQNSNVGPEHIRVLDVSVPGDLRSDELAPHRFWEHAFLAAYLVSEGKRIFVHGADSDSRAEMFIAGIRIVQGHEPDDAIERISQSGSKLKAEQTAFLRDGIPRPIMETMPPDPEPQPEEGPIDVFSKEAQERALEESENPNSEYNRSQHGPNDHYRILWEQRCSVSDCDPALQQHGLRTIVDPMSEAWLQTTHQEKVRAFRAALPVILSDKIQSTNLVRWSVAIERLLLRNLASMISVSHDAFVLAGTCFLQAAVDLDYFIPSTKEETAELVSSFYEFQDGRKVRSVSARFERGGLGDLPLGREEIDLGSSEGQNASVDHKIERVKAVVQSDLPLIGAIALFCSRYGDSGQEHVVSALPRNLFALAAYGFQRAS